MITEKHLIFSDNSDSPENSHFQKRKDMSHLSRRDLSRLDDGLDVTSGGGGGFGAGHDTTQYVFDAS